MNEPLLNVMKEINDRFSEAAKNGKTKPKWVPTIAEPTEVLRVPCTQCNALGTVWKSYVPEGGMAPVAGKFPCPQCNGLSYFEHHFPAAIVKLAKGLAHQDELSIARALTGFAMGMEIAEP